MNIPSSRCWNVIFEFEMYEDVVWKLPSIKLSAFNPNFWIAKNDNLWRNPSRRNHLTLFLWCQAYKSNDKRVNFSWFYVTNFFPRFSDHSAEIHTKRKVSCWKMTIRINWKMKEGVIVCFGGESNFSKRSKNLQFSILYT